MRQAACLHRERNVAWNWYILNEFVTYDADLLLANIILGASELKCLKFMKF